MSKHLVTVGREKPLCIVTHNHAMPLKSCTHKADPAAQVREGGRKRKALLRACGDAPALPLSQLHQCSDVIVPSTDQRGLLESLCVLKRDN